MRTITTIKNRNDPGNFEDAMQGRILLMTALTPAYTHALQNVCLGQRAGDILVRTFGRLVPKANHRNLPNVRTTTRLVSDGFRG